LDEGKLTTFGGRATGGARRSAVDEESVLLPRRIEGGNHEYVTRRGSDRGHRTVMIMCMLGLFLRLGVAVKRLSVLVAVPLGVMALITGTATGRDPCQGRQLLATPRPASSCKNVKPSTFRSPDGALTAFVFPADPSLNTTPDMESRIEIRPKDGHALTSKDYSSPRGANGYYVVRAKWTRDSQFFVFTLSSSGGHSPWSFPMAVYSRERNAVVKFSDMIGGNPTLSEDFRLTGDHTVIATTWKDQNIEKKISVTVDLKEALAKLPAGQ
jgi:hypothetical protein